MADLIFGGNQGVQGATNTPITFGVSLKTRSEFEGIQSSIPIGQIVFLKNDQTIYCDGEYFGLSAADAQRLDNVINGVQSLKSELGYQSESWNSFKTKTNAAQSTLAQGLLNLKEQIGNGGYQGAQNLTMSQAIVNLQTAINGIQNGTGNVTSVNNLSGAVTLTSDNINVGTQGPQGFQGSNISSVLNSKVSISTDDNSNKPNSGIQGALLTNTASIATAIEAAYTEAVSAKSFANGVQTNANNKIAKSPGDTTKKPISGAQGSALIDAASIAQAIEKGAQSLLGTSSKWGSEPQTLGQLRTLIDTIQTSITGMDPASSEKILNIIKELKQVDDSEIDDFANTILDKLILFLKYSDTYSSNGTAGAQGGYYQVSTYSSGNTGHQYVNNVQDIITKLEAYVDAKAIAAQQAATGGSVTGIQATGATVSGDGSGNYKNGNVSIYVDSSTVGMQSALSKTDGKGAEVAAGVSIQTAMESLNTAIKAAHSLAETAEGHAQQALGLMNWVII